MTVDALLDDLVNYLNQLNGEDPDGTHVLVEGRVGWAVRESKYAVQDPDGNVGPLGLINGWLNRYTDNRLVGVYDDANGKLLRFTKLHGA